MDVQEELEQLRMCSLCPYAMYAALVQRGGSFQVVFYCERCDRSESI